MLTNVTVLKTNLLILCPTWPGAGNHTNCLQTISIQQILSVRTNEYVNEQMTLFKKGTISVVVKHSKQYKII